MGHEQSTTGGDRSTINVVVVDDEDTIRRVVAYFLTGAGYQVETYANPQGALDALDGQWDRVDLLLTDIDMPEMGGVELAATARVQHPELRVLFMSGSSIVDRAEVGLLLEKPFSEQALLAMVETALEARDRGRQGCPSTRRSREATSHLERQDMTNAGSSTSIGPRRAA